MPFQAPTAPQIPTPNTPTPVPNTAVTYKVATVANTVNVGGTLSYNTSSNVYDVIYQAGLTYPVLSSANTTSLTLIAGTGISLTANTPNNSIDLSTTSLSHAQVMSRISLGF
jgi:hypothetical protein